MQVEKATAKVISRKRATANSKTSILPSQIAIATAKVSSIDHNVKRQQLRATAKGLRSQQVNLATAKSKGLISCSRS